MPRKALIQIRRGLETDIGALAVGEMGYCTDTQKLYIGTVTGNVLLLAAQTVGDMLKSIYDTNNNGKVDQAELSDAVPWSGVLNKPSTFAPAAHKASHTIGGTDPLSPADIGAETPAAAQQKVDVHAANTTNPHNVTKSQVGLGSVSNYGLATQAEAEAGTSSSKYMTPLRTKQAIDRLAMPAGPLTWNQLKGV